LSKSKTEGFFIEVRVDIAFGIYIVPFVATLMASFEKTDIWKYFLSKILLYRQTYTTF